MQSGKDKGTAFARADLRLGEHAFKAYPCNRPIKIDESLLMMIHYPARGPLLSTVDGSTRTKKKNMEIATHTSGIKFFIEV